MIRQSIIVLQLIALSLLTSCSTPGATVEDEKQIAVIRELPPETCLLHNVEMDTEAVPVLYGQPQENSETRQAMQMYFPNARMVVFGGTSPTEMTSQLVRYCPKCREQRDRWLMQHQRGRGR